MKRIVVTGATSMLAVALIEEALKTDIEEIAAAVRPASKNLSRLPADPRLKIVECDVADTRRLPELLNGSYEAFYHFGWPGTGPHRNDDIRQQLQSASYTLDALDAAKELGCTKFIGAGSQAEYGVLDLPKISPETDVRPVQIYGITKYAAGQLALQAAERMGMDCLWVRIFSVYGFHNKPTAMIPRAMEAFSKKERMPFTPAEQKWDYLFSEDAGRAFLAIGEKSKGQKVYCLGFGKSRPLSEYIRAIAGAMGADESLIGIGDLPYPKNCVMNICADIESLTADTGWKPEISFEEGMRRYVAEPGRWF